MAHILDLQAMDGDSGARSGVASVPSATSIYGCLPSCMSVVLC